MYLGSVISEFNKGVAQPSADRAVAYFFFGKNCEIVNIMAKEKGSTLVIPPLCEAWENLVYSQCEFT